VLEPVVADRSEALLKVAGLLKDDPRVVDWEAFYAQLCKSSPCRCEDEANFAICLPHARTDAVTEMVMSVGRFDPMLDFPEILRPVRYVFVIGAPVALAADYLRIVGLLMRVIRNPDSEKSLDQARTAEAFIDVLTSFEVKL
jgi:PTS system nitrogen regulatory IIA component